MAGMRGLAAFGVVLFHASILFPSGISAVTSTFYLGVPLFLMMSMYLLLRRLDSNDDLRRYFIRRIVRIWPIYFGTLVAFYLIFPFPFWDFVRYLFFVEYYVNPYGYFPVSIFWTLQLEEAVYVFIPLIHKLRLSHQRLLAVGFVAVGIAFLSIMSQTSLGTQSIVYLQMLIPVSLIAYGLGILVHAGRFPRAVGWLAFAGISALALLNLTRADSVMSHYDYFFTANVILYTLTLVGFASILSNPPRFLGWFAVLGEESYALYAVHYAFVTIFGVVGIVYAVTTAFLIEFSLRHGEILRRLKLSYPGMDRLLLGTPKPMEPPRSEKLKTS